MYNALTLAANEWRDPIFHFFLWWQLVAIALLVVLIIFWLQYRKRQM